MNNRQAGITITDAAPKLDKTSPPACLVQSIIASEAWLLAFAR